MSELVARSHHKMVECVFGVEDRLKGMGGRLFVAWWRWRDRILSVRPFASDSELKLTGRMGEKRDHILDMKGIVFVDPLLEKSVRDL